MKFPLIKDVASCDVVFVTRDQTLSDAIALMLAANHRNVIVRDGNDYFILTVVDVLNIKMKEKNLDKSLKDLPLQRVHTISKEKNILDTLEYLNHGVEYLCVLDDDASLFGIVTHTDIMSNIDPDTLMENYRLADFLKLGKRMKWVSKEEKTSSLLQEMMHSSFDNVVIVENLKPIGILTTKDIVRLIQSDVDFTLSVEHYMSHPVETILKDTTIKEALLFLQKKKYKRAIVVNENGELSGIISQKELISLTYSRWLLLMKEYQAELREINTLLEDQNKEFEQKASTDLLTGLYNRYKFSELYLISYQTMVQRNGAMSLILLDIDFFKKVNDQHGHNSGDRVLVQVAHALLKNLRNIDIVCRWGGEEFIVLLPTATLENARVLAEKIRCYIHEMPLDTVGHISVSLGVAEVHPLESMESVIERADKALYLAKRCGRNCVKTQEDL